MKRPAKESFGGVAKKGKSVNLLRSADVVEKFVTYLPKLRDINAGKVCSLPGLFFVPS